MIWQVLIVYIIQALQYHVKHIEKISTDIFRWIFFYCSMENGLSEVGFIIYLTFTLTGRVYAPLNFVPSIAETLTLK